MATVNYCEHCGASVNPKAKYCQTCGKVISSRDAPRDPIDRIVESSLATAMSLSGIIQAAALGYLLVVIRSQFNKLTGPNLDPIYAILIIASFLVIAIIWFETFMATQSFRYQVNLWSLILPFVIGTAQFLLILSIDLQKVAWWYLSLSLVTLVAFFSFDNSYRRARLFYEENRVVLERLGATTLTTEISILVVTLIYFCFGVLESIWKLNSLYIAIVALAIIIVWIVRENSYWKKIIKR